jgi:hypothetical protein
MLKRIPRQILAVNVYGYVVVAVIVVVAAALLLTADDLGLLDLGLLAALVGGAGAVWWRFHPRLPASQVLTVEDFLRLARANHLHTLLALESEYCAMCMAAGGRITALDGLDGLCIYRFSIHAAPGHALYAHFGGRLTPYYVFFDPQGTQIAAWHVALPTEHIMQTVQAARAA